MLLGSWGRVCAFVRGGLRREVICRVVVIVLRNARERAGEPGATTAIGWHVIS